MPTSPTPEPTRADTFAARRAARQQREESPRRRLTLRAGLDGDTGVGMEVRHVEQ